MKTVFLVPHTHYDVVWAFTKEDYQYINEMVLRKALKMIRDCGYKFLIAQAYPIEQIEQCDSQFFNELKEAISGGKLEVVDGQYMMRDPIIPHGETLVREIMVGKHYLKDTLGIDVPVAWASDGFGLNAQMPQIYKKAGYCWLVFRRGLPRSIGYRVCEFLWEGLEGITGLGHVRLAIVGGRDGVRPFHSKDGRVSLLHNGEIYNHHELRKSLPPEVNFDAKTDSEVILRLLE